MPFKHDAYNSSSRQDVQHFFVTHTPYVCLSDMMVDSCYKPLIPLPSSISRSKVLLVVMWCTSGVKSDAYVYFVGSSGSGKSTLISRFLYPNKVCSSTAL
jgi:ABC-type multidrug transport system fused ATPase/permease subunit